MGEGGNSVMAAGTQAGTLDGLARQDSLTRWQELKAGMPGRAAARSARRSRAKHRRLPAEPDMMHGMA